MSQAIARPIAYCSAFPILAEVLRPMRALLRPTWLPSYLALLSLLASGCAASGKQAKPDPAPTASTATPSQSLYERLGGKPAITAVVGDFVGRVTKDDRINQRFANADLPHLKALLVEQVCAATGGPCTYTGRDMKSVHTGMGISDAEFDALVGDVRQSLEHFKVGEREQGELLGALGSMRKDVVEKPYAPEPVSGLEAVTERARALRDAAELLDKAGAARGRGNRSFAEQLFSSAELLVGPEAVADLARLFREGAPPRVTTPLEHVAANSPAQPATVGNSDEEDTGAQAPKAPTTSSLAGTLRVSGAGSELGVITLTPASGKFRKRQPKQRVMEQRGRQFAPRVLVVPVGSTVSFPNFDPVYHNVFSTSEAKSFDLGLYKSDTARSMVFDKAGVVRLGCNLHANMSAYIVVVAAPHYVITDEQGAFQFKHLAPGRYVLEAWSERSLAPVVRKIVVKPGRNTIALDAKGDAPSGLSPDKFGVTRGSKS